MFDTFSEHFRLPDLNYNERKRIISQALMGLLTCAAKHGLSVVIVNQMKNRKKDFLHDGPVVSQQSSKPEPLFGEDLFQCVTNRVMLERDHNSTEDNIIRGKLVKGSVASHFPYGPAAYFQVCRF